MITNEQLSTMLTQALVGVFTDSSEVEVTLRANKKEGWKRQRATVVGVEVSVTGQVILAVDVPPEDEFDDGLREVTLDQVE